MSIPIFQQDGFRIGIGDSNRDGKLDFDFGLRSETWGNSPWGSGHSGAEIGFNTDRGVYAGGDYSSHNQWGSHGGGGRVFADGGYESGNWSNDVFGNHHANYQNQSPFHFESASRGGNVYNGNYYGHQTNSNHFETAHSNWGGNSWTGEHASNHQYGNVFGGGGGFSTYSPPMVPQWGGGHYGGNGCGCAGGFFGW
jgi:hypothetical protein